MTSMRKSAVALLAFLSVTGIALPAQAQSLDRARFGFVAAHDQTFKSEVVIPAALRRSSNWKGAILIGAIAGVAFGAAVASQNGDEGSDRSTGDRVKSGLLAGAMIAVPVTVIVAMLTGD